MARALKFSLLFIIFLFIIWKFSTVSLALNTKNFSDISNYEYRSSIEELAAQNIIDGYVDGTFKPNLPINRAEFLKIVLESKKLTIQPSQTNCFPDVKEDWFAKYVCFAFSEKIIEGYPDGFFRPEKKE